MALYSRKSRGRFVRFLPLWALLGFAASLHAYLCGLQHNEFRWRAFSARWQVAVEHLRNGRFTRCSPPPPAIGSRGQTEVRNLVMRNALPGAEAGLAIAGSLLRALVTFFGLPLAVIFVLQRKLLFLPDSNAAVPPCEDGNPQIIMLPTEDGKQKHVAIHYPPTSEDAPTLVYFHGNADQIGYGAAVLGRHFQYNDDLGLFGIEYPGYGLAQPGSPNESSIYGAAEALLKHLVYELGVDNSKVVLFGQSIGCAVAIEMAKRGYGSRMVLLAPFTSVPDMACNLYSFLTPVLKIAPFFVLDRFDNESKAPSLNIPTLVIHGTEDEIVPFWMGSKLADTIPGASLLEVPGMGHNDLFERDDVLQAVVSWADPTPDEADDD